MTRFVCGTCGATVEEPFALQFWHRCQGRLRELRPVDPPPEPPAPAAGPLTLF